MYEVESAPRIYHMTCDICGKKEDIVEADRNKSIAFWTRSWSRIIFKYSKERIVMCSFGFGSKPPEKNVLYDEEYKELDICPECTKKFKKLVKMVELDEDKSQC